MLALPSEFAEAHEEPGSAKSLGDHCGQLLAAAVDAGSARRLTPEIAELATRYPDEFEPQYAYCLVRELTRVRSGMLDLWIGLHERFPKSYKALRYRVRWLVRSNRIDEARALIGSFFSDEPEVAATSMEKADLLLETRDIDGGKAIYEAAIRAASDDIRPRLRYSRRLREQGDLVAALDILNSIEISDKTPESVPLVKAELSTALVLMRATASELLKPGISLRPIALYCALQQFWHRNPRPLAKNRLGATTFITGSLGAGGAERQLSRTVAWFEHARRTGSKLGGIEVKGPFQVVVRSLAEEDRNDFFLPTVSDASIEAFQIDHLPTVEFDQLGIDNPIVAALVPFLPSSAAFGVQCLSRFFREHRTEVAFIWQDGAVLMAALAALIAGVPRIVISLRGLPPTLRGHRHREEYPLMYQALAAIPGIHFTSNSEAVVHAYSDWLELPRSRFSVIHNGVEPLPTNPSSTDEALWAAFDLQTGGAGRTIGGVFRYDLDKNPLLWIRFAQRYLAIYPDARFVLVGGGRLFDTAKALASELGVASRILFAGVSQSVGHWLTKMDALVLLSRFEGLPNVLIEAQLAGIGVVTTPAGGACEAFLPNVTGLALSSAASPDLEELCGAVDTVLAWRRDHPGSSEQIARFANHRFAPQAMVAKMAKLLCEDCGFGLAAADEFEAKPVKVTEPLELAESS